MEKMRVELAGRYRLTSELLRAGINVALPVYDSGIDLIAYVESKGTLTARPIQMKASSQEAFGVDRKYEKSPSLIVAYVWHVDQPDQAITYAMTFKESADIAGELGWTRTESWQRGAYVSTRPSKRIHDLLEPHRMTPDKWRKLVAGYAAADRGPHHNGASETER